MRAAVAALVIESRLPQTFLAAKMGLSPTWFSRWLHPHGRDQILSVRALDRLLEFLRNHHRAIGATIATLEDAFARAEIPDAPDSHRPGRHK